MASQELEACGGAQLPQRREGVNGVVKQLLCAQLSTGEGILKRLLCPLPWSLCFSLIDICVVSGGSS